AKSERKQLVRQVDKLRREVIAEQTERSAYRELLALYRLDNRLSVSDYHPVTATVVAKSPNIWYSTVTIDKGEAAGVHINDLGERRKRLPLGQRASAGRPAQPRRGPGPDLGSGQHAREGQRAGREPAGGPDRCAGDRRHGRARLRHDGQMSAWEHTAASRAKAHGLFGPSFSPGIVARIALLAVIVVFFQTGVVSELSVLGVTVDLSPLLVAFVGLLCGSMLGAITGFAVGLLVDLALVQTLGVTSLIFTLIGYWSGRLRELR